MSTVTTEKSKTTSRKAKVLHDYAIEGVNRVHGLTYDGANVWFADGTRGGLTAVDPRTGKTVKRLADVPADAGTAFDGTHLWQLAEDRIQKIDPKTGKILSTLPAPGKGKDSGMTWAEGALWIGQYKERLIHKVDPKTGKVLKTIASDRFVTGVTWIDGELWHGTAEDQVSDIRRVDPESGKLLDRIELPAGTAVAGVEADDRGRIWYADTNTGHICAIARR